MQPSTDKFCRRRQAANTLGSFLDARIFNTTVILPPDLNALTVAAEAGDPEAVAAVRGVSRWLSAVERQTARMQCVVCDQAFLDTDQADGFAVITPFADPTHLIVSGICAGCAARHSDLLAVVVQRAGAIWDQIQVISAGRA